MEDVQLRAIQLLDFLANPELLMADGTATRASLGCAGENHGSQTSQIQLLSSAAYSEGLISVVTCRLQALHESSTCPCHLGQLLV